MRHWYGPAPRRSGKHSFEPPTWRKRLSGFASRRPATIRSRPAGASEDPNGGGTSDGPSWWQRLRRGDHGSRVVIALAVSVVLHAVLVVLLALMLRGVASSGGTSVVSLDLGSLEDASIAEPFEQPAEDAAEPIAAEPIEAGPASGEQRAQQRQRLEDAAERIASADLGTAPSVQIDRGQGVERGPVAEWLDRGGGTDAAIADPGDISGAIGLEGASFAGVSATRARRVVYAVDASGAMVSSLPFVLDEVRRSVSALAPDQAFAVLLFGRLPGDAGEGSAVRAFPASGLRAATPAHKAELFEWLADAQARGASNPLDGLLAAIEREPEVVFLLSRSIRRTVGQEGQGDWGPGLEAILAELDKANPVRRSIFGPPARAVQVKCVQFLAEDPTGVMRGIAEAHGGGPGSYRLLSEEEIRRR